MELKKVELTGFKSFPEKICVEFDRGITAIVGPNGSGKSNISDAIRWVLGEQSARTLRGSKMEDVIFAGTERRKPVNFAQVTLVLDNSDRKMAIDYDEVAISRKVFRSGESEYTINGGRCRLRDVQELLMDTGIGKDGYSIIGQGQIDQLLSSKPQDRRMIFEEAAGIVKYKSRKETAEKQLAEEENNLSRVQDILEELTSRIEPLTAQAEAARQYLTLKEELKTYEVTAFLGQYQQYRDQFAKVEGHLENLLEQLAGAKTRQEEIRLRTEAYKKEAGEARQAYKELNDLHHSLEISLQSKEGEKGRLQEQQSARERERDRLTEDLDEAKKKLHVQWETIRAEEEKIKEKEAQYKAQEEKRQEAAQALEKWHGCQQERRQSWTEAAEKAEACKQETAERRARTERFQAMLEYDRSQKETLLEKEKELETQQTLREEEVRRAETLRKELAEDCRKKDEEFRQLMDRIQTLRQEIREKQQQQEKTVTALRETQSRLKWLKDLEREYEGFSSSVKSVMQMKKADPHRFAKVRGTLSDLITVPEELAVAMEIALGPAVQNIVTEDQDCARQVIDILRREQKGRATFLPMDRVSGRGEIRDRQKILALPGIRGFAHELIGYDRQYKEIISRQLGNVLVAEDFDSAAEAARQYGNTLRVVTLKGDIFNIGGSITGGSTMKAGNILGRKGEIDSLTRALAQRQRENEQAQKETEALTARRQEMNQRLEELGAAQDEAKARLRSAETREEQARFLLKQTAEQRESSRDLHRTLEETNREHLESLEQYAEEVRQQEEREAAAVQEAAEKQAAHEEAVREEAAARSRELELRITCSGLTQEIEYMRRNTEKEREEADSLTARAEDCLEGIQACSDQQEQLRCRLEELAAEQEELERRIREKGEETREMEEQQNQKSRLWDESMQAAEEVLRQIGDLEKEQVRLENQKARAQKDLTDLQDRIWEDYELTYTAALTMERKDLGSPAAMKRRIGELREQIRSLGSVNVDAITELTALQERCAFLSEQRDDITRSEESLREIIGQLQTQMEKQFAEGFQKIAQLFEETFCKLFGGGRALLQLTEGEDALEAGVEIIAQPPGKKLQNMMLLSGGERTLTAISLLFAIQQLNPAPFCILDEIEAALDDVNVSRFASYLQELCGKTQFIVITHRKGTMEAAHTMYGVTMEEKGISKCISVKFENQETM